MPDAVQDRAVMFGSVHHLNNETPLKSNKSWIIDGMSLVNSTSELALKNTV